MFKRENESEQEIVQEVVQKTDGGVPEEKQEGKKSEHNAEGMQEEVPETKGKTKKHGRGSGKKKGKEKQAKNNSGNLMPPHFQMVKKITLCVVAGIFLVFTFFQTMYSLEEDEYAVLRTFGSVQVVETPGIKFKIPYIQKVYKVSKASKQFSVGYDLKTDQSIDKESFMITSDYNFVNIDFYFEYQITDPIQYFYASDEPEIIVKNLAQSYIRDTVGSHGVDDVLTTGKYAIQSEIKEKLQKRLEAENIGIQITNAVIQDAEVPTKEVAQAFKNVEDAKQGMETAINNANADANTRIPAANAEADKIVKNAQAQKEALIAEAEGQAARFNSLYQEYIKFPLITKQRMFYETMEEVLPSMKIYITDGATQSLLPLEAFSTYSTGEEE